MLDADVANAIRLGRLDRVSALWPRVKKPNATDARGNTYLHLAVQTKNHNLCNFLLGSGVNPNRYNDDGLTPLNLACFGGPTKSLLKTLIAWGADITARDDTGKRPFDRSAIIRTEATHWITGMDLQAPLRSEIYYDALCNLLLRINSDNTDDGYLNVLATAVGPHLNRDLDNPTLNYHAERREPPLFIAAKKGHVNIYRLLLDNGADAEGYYRGQRAYEVAQYETTKLLLLHENRSYSGAEVLGSKYQGMPFHAERYIYSEPLINAFTPQETLNRETNSQLNINGDPDSPFDTDSEPLPPRKTSDCTLQ